MSGQDTALEAFDQNVFLQENVNLDRYEFEPDQRLSW